MSQRQHRIEIALPEDFLELCDNDMVSPKKVLCDFIADLCDITSQHREHSIENYLSNGSADRDRARVYYDRIHAWRANWFRENVPHLVPGLWVRKEDDAETDSQNDGECQSEQGPWAKYGGDGPEAGCALCSAEAQFWRVVRSYCDLA